MSPYVDRSCLLQYNCGTRYSVFSLIVLAECKVSRDDGNQDSISGEIASINRCNVRIPNEMKFAGFLPGAME